ncbi:MAG: PDZ domain-containing protein [Acidimicrobiaceae bacterium]|nr:PDZ domain-containing protein [Acidimicrobiaceae bacterium]MYL04404.1 PDZ domain-containing protein [Acidimicrobiaceae bacterium]
MRLARRAVAAALAALVVWPTVALAQEPVAEPGAEDPPGVETRAERVACEEAPAVFEVLCQSYELLSEYYVDDVPDEDWAAAAARGVREAGLAPRGDEPAPACALPAPAFEEACVEIDAVDDTEAAVWAASKAIFASRGDPNNFLMNRSEYQQMLARMEGGVPYVGIGISLGLLDGAKHCHALSESCRAVVAEVFASSPAERAGLMADDIVVSLDGYVPSGPECGLGGLHPFELGSVVRVVVERNGRQRSFAVDVEPVQIPTVDGRTVAGNIGYLRLSSFGSQTDELAERELQALLDAGVDNLVVDLRDNPGGFLQTVINIASMFLENRQVVIQEVSRRQTLLHLVSGDNSRPDPSVLPITMVVDAGSASASEVLALALRDHGRATVVGTITFGKNTGQITQPLYSRDGTLLGGARVTLFRWLGPEGESAAGGIQPDVELDLAACWHPIALARQVAAAAGLPGVLPADIDLAGERYDAVKALTEDGVFTGTECAPGLFCPDDPIARWVMAVWLVRVLDGQDPEPVSASRFADVDGDLWWAAHVERLAELGVTGGCRREPAQYCPDDPVTRGQMATFLRRAFSFPAAAPRGFEDTGGSVHEANIDSLHRAGITAGCSTEPMRFCPEQATSRVQMALLLERVRNYLN